VSCDEVSSVLFLNGSALRLITTSYEFHKGLESPIAFVRREWPALAIFGGGFILVLLVGILAVSPAYFYPRLETDPLLYYLKGKAFAETGSTVAHAYVNREPFTYVGMPGVLRSPFIMAFRDFDNQLRAIQLSNVVLVTMTAILFAYILSWAVPKKWHWLAIGFTFGFMLLSPEWVANVFEPLADAPYAFFTIGCLLITQRLLSSDRAISARWWAIALALLCFAIAFLTRFTAPVLLVYAGVLAAGRKRHHQLPPRLVAVGAIAAVVVVAVLVGLNWETIRSRYLIEPYMFLTRAPKNEVIMNLVGLALPSQLISDFRLGFTDHPIVSTYHVKFPHAPQDIVLAAIGVIISLIIFFGIWRSRRSFLPEIAYLLAALPVLTLMIPSTARYLMAYQPFFWIFFFVGASALFGRAFARIANARRAALTGISALVLAGAALVLLRTHKVVGTVGSPGAAVSIGESRAYIKDVSTTFHDLRRFLETLPRERTLIIGQPGTVGRWKVISGLDYYRPDSALTVTVSRYDTYLLLECGTYEVCQGFDYWDGKYRERVDQFGKFAFEPVFSRLNEHAKVKLYRLRNLQ
jgi:hypothetical protein